MNTRDELIEYLKELCDEVLDQSILENPIHVKAHDIEYDSEIMAIINASKLFDILSRRINVKFMMSHDEMSSHIRILRITYIMAEILKIDKDFINPDEPASSVFKLKVYHGSDDSIAVIEDLVLIHEDYESVINAISDSIYSSSMFPLFRKEFINMKESESDDSEEYNKFIKEIDTLNDLLAPFNIDIAYFMNMHLLNNGEMPLEDIYTGKIKNEIEFMLYEDLSERGLDPFLLIFGKFLRRSLAYESTTLDLYFVRSRLELTKIDEHMKHLFASEWILDYMSGLFVADIVAEEDKERRLSDYDIPSYYIDYLNIFHKFEEYFGFDKDSKLRLYDNERTSNCYFILDTIKYFIDQANIDLDKYYFVIAYWIRKIVDLLLRKIGRLSSYEVFEKVAETLFLTNDSCYLNTNIERSKKLIPIISLSFSDHELCDIPYHLKNDYIKNTGCFRNNYKYDCSRINQIIAVSVMQISRLNREIKDIDVSIYLLNLEENTIIDNIKYLSDIIVQSLSFDNIIMYDCIDESPDYFSRIMSKITRAYLWGLVIDMKNDIQNIRERLNQLITSDSND